MDIITEGKINEVMSGLRSLGNDPFSSLFEKMDVQQHFITDYLFEVEGDYFNQDERDLLISFTTLGWHIVNETLKIEKEITDDELSARLDNNADILNKKEKEMGNIDAAVASMLADESEAPFLMLFLMLLIIDRPDEYGGTIRDDSVPVIIIHIKTIMDCLIASAVH